mgnify:CR=1 FL=1
MFENIKKRFPVFDKNPDLVFLDTAASALKVDKMINSITECYSYEYANIHRGIYDLSAKLTKRYEESRSSVSKFINSPSSENIIFTKSATEAINLVSSCFSEKFLSKDDEVIISYLEHHANIVPWHIAAKKYGFKIIDINLDKENNIDINDLEKKINNRTKIISLTHMSNVTGAITDIESVSKIAKKNSIPFLIDGCQYVAHAPVNLKDLGCDFYVYSGHKIYGPTGVGVLYMKNKWFELFDPYQGGGSMIDKVEIDNTTFSKGFQKFEAGTPPIAEVIGLGASLDFINEVGIDKIYEYENNLTQYAYDQIKRDNDIIVYGDFKNQTSIISFNLNGVHFNDLAMLLDKKNIAIRTGHHCAQPFMKCFNISGNARMSVGIYNTRDEIDYFIKSLNDVKIILKS